MYKHARSSPAQRVSIRNDQSRIDDGPSEYQRAMKAAYDAAIEAQRATARASMARNGHAHPKRVRAMIENAKVRRRPPQRRP